jgi:CHAT domain-containing protein
MWLSLGFAALRARDPQGLRHKFGPLQLGEGAWTISRAFLVAGSKRVVCSQRPVNDQAASVLMTDFADAIADSMTNATMDAAKSLHKSKRKLRRATPETANPTYWAPFVLVGAP